MRVLVLEDEFLIAIDVEQLCRDLGAGDVVIACRLAQVPGAISGSPFDFAVIDVSVGGESTLDVAARLRHANTPFVFATGYADTDVLFTAFPDVPVLSKPYSSGDFARAVQAVLGARCRAQAALDPSTCDAIASGP